MNNLLILPLAVLVAGYLYRRYSRLTESRSRLPYPPGPKPKPFIGNALDIPTQTAWLTYIKWGEIYKSDILHIEALGQHIVILNSLEAATDMLERRASVYSSRPSVPMLELMDLIDFNASLLPHDDQWRRHRRVFQQSFRKDAAILYEPIEMRKIHQMLGHLLESPDEFRMHIRTMAAAIVMAIVYGHNVSTMDDKYVAIAEEAIDRAGKALLPGASLVNTIPVLRYIPPWFPGATFHQVAGKVRELTHQMQNSGFEFVRRNMRDGTGEPSLLQSLLEANDASGGSAEHETILKGVCATAYAAGSDTTVSSIATFFYAMAISPNVQRRAQDEIDAVVGNDRVPEPGDRASLPYVEAIFREVMRWRPVLPMALPHTSTEDDVYRGYFIPKGSMVLPNVWAMNHNKNIYENPGRFQPERHFDSRGELGEDDAIPTFGFGRRVCVGRHLASTTVWLAIVSVLATLDIAKARDSQGNEIDIDGDYTDGALIHPRPFPCSITPRSLKMRELIRPDE